MLNSEYFIRNENLPEGFTYPSEYTRIVGLGIIYLEPWFILKGEQLNGTFQGLKSRFPNKTLIPFSKRQDCDDVACWLNNSAKSIVIIHDFATPGFEEREIFSGFWSWFRRAVEDMIQFE
ncbi:MAG: hypothetical protein HQM08_29465 [Candidatus Riflebacteria bacterium]|nr:hypothetical protein [Candidatus Riflebacteria bacterium]